MTKPTSTARIEALVQTMTLDEKIGQMNLISADLAITGPKVTGDYLAAIRAGRIGTVSTLWGAELAHEVQRVAVEETRLGIPLLFALDVIHGHRTVFPIPLAEAAAFDPGLWQRTARIAAIEATADGLNFNYAPMLDVSRDLRWGRIAESPGEDPWLAARFAEAKVRGFQGDDLSASDAMAATAKHLAGYGAATAGRDYASVDISERTLHEVYMPPFRAAVAAGAVGIMPGFHDLAGVPMTAHQAILRDLVRGTWGFDGVMVSDYNAITELLEHGVAEDIAEAAALALAAGVDIDLMGEAYTRGLATALERGRVTMGDIDTAVRRILTLKETLGLFDDPYRRGRADFLPPATVDAHRASARDCARRSIVLLTNEGNVLPLADVPRRMAVLGPLANAPAEMLGPWAISGQAEDMVSLLTGIQAAFPASDIFHARGVAIEDHSPEEAAAALDLARDADVILLCLGEAALMSGEAASRAQPGLPGHQEAFARAALDLGKPVIVLLSSGRPLLCPWLFEQADAVLATWFLGSEAGNAVGDVLSGRYNPSGRLPVTWPVDVGQIPITYDYRPTGRPPDPNERFCSKYLDLPVDPLFPFGHGLSYARFELGEPRAAPAEVRPGARVTIEVDVANVGAVAGEETVLLFSHDPVASLARPVLELEGMAKIKLAPDERGTVRFTLEVDDLAFLGADLSPRLEPGVVDLLVGQSADRQTLHQTSIRILAH